MTPDEFAEIVFEGDPEKLIAAVAPLNESQRRKLSKIAARIECSRSHEPYTQLLEEFRARLQERFRPYRDVFVLALAAVGSFKQVRSLFEYGTHRNQDALRRVLIDRKPEWLDRWVDMRLNSETAHWLEWDFLRPLIRAGACKRPTTDAYWRWLAFAPLRGFGPKDKRLSAIVAEDVELLAELWKFFEVETRALFVNSDHRDAASTYDSWQSALVELSEQGHLDRQRLLNESLKALNNDFINDALAGYMQLFDRLKPTVDERACRQSAFVALLASPKSHVVTFSTQKIVELERVEKLDREAFLTGMSPVFQTRTKGQPIAALRLVEKIGKRAPELLPHAVAGVLEALAHPAADVQKLAIGLIDAWIGRLHPDHAATIRERLDQLAPSVRSNAEALVARLCPAPVHEEETITHADETVASLAELIQAADELPPPWRQRAGVDEALASLHAGKMPEPLEFDVLDARVLTGVEPIVPIADVHELIDAVAHAVEVVDSADEVERILDAISSLCDQRPADFERRTEPLVKRIAESHIDNGTRGLATQGLSPESLYQLLWLWLRGRLPSARYERPECPVIEHFFDGRVRELMYRVQNGRAAPLLAAPTHRGGWIDPGTFIDRLAAMNQAGIPVYEYDMIQALLRLAPDGRAEVLARCPHIPGYPGRYIAWALGGSEGPAADSSEHPSLWLAASRARQPTADLQELAALGIAPTLPDAAAHASYVWQSRPAADEKPRPWERREFRPIEIRVEPTAAMETCPATWPTSALHGRGPESWFVSAWRIEALAQVWPLRIDSFLAQAAEALAERLDQPASSFQPNHAYLRPLLELDRTWSEMAVLAIWMGVMSKDADARTTALDALIEAIADGRAHPRAMSGVLSKLHTGGWLKLNRIADALSETARVSPLHTWFSAETLQAFVAAWEELPRDAHFILSLLNELLIELGTVLSPAALDRLASVQGTSKTAKAAAALRKLTPLAKAVKLRHSGLQVLEARIARANRWAGRHDARKAIELPH